MTQPVLTHMWVKVYPDDQALPQFDPETGIQNPWGTEVEQLAKVLLVPFSPELVNKVAQHQIAAIATTDPPVEFIVRSGEHVEAGIDGAVTYYDYFLCDICGWKWQHQDSTKFARCPQCGAADEWFCSRCKTYKETYRVTKKGQVQCLDCDIPVGLDRERHLRRLSDISHSCDYFIRSKDRKVTLRDNGSILVE
jgi:predicted RNA-binding Zn-ribbon protein involved in translation (DUF1610 family)